MAGDPVVVQGTAVGGTVIGGNNQYGQPTPSEDPNFTKGEKQESKCRDPIFAFLLYANLAAIAIVCVFYGAEAFESVDDGVQDDFDYSAYLYTALTCGIFAIILSGAGLLVMMCIPSLLIKTSLIFVVVLSGVWAIMGFLAGNIIMGVFGVIFFFIGMCYARAVWSRIPFATANLLTACTAIRSNCGIVIISFLFVAVAFGWTFVWTIAFLGTFNSTYSCETVGDNQVCNGVNYGYLFLLMLSYFFTHQVISNTVHVTVAGTVGVWWFDPENGSSCCSTAVIGSMTRYVFFFFVLSLCCLFGDDIIATFC